MVVALLTLSIFNYLQIFHRVSKRMKQLACDTAVWKKVFKKIWEHINLEDFTEDLNMETMKWERTYKEDIEDFTEETLKRLVDFCNQTNNVSPEMRSEVVKVAATMFEFPEPVDPFERSLGVSDSDDSDDQDGSDDWDDQEKSKIMIRLRIGGLWGFPQTLEVDGNRLEELIKVEEKVGARATIVAVEIYSELIEDMKIKLIADRVRQNPGSSDHVEQNPGELTMVDLGTVDLSEDSEHSDMIPDLVSLLKASKRWSIGRLILESEKDVWTALANVAHTGSIFDLHIWSSDTDVGAWLRDVNREDVRKVWEATYDLGIEMGMIVTGLGEILFEMEWFHGGRLNNTGGDWQRMVKFLDSE